MESEFEKGLEFYELNDDTLTCLDQIEFFETVESDLDNFDEIPF